MLYTTNYKHHAATHKLFNNQSHAFTALK